MHKSRSIKVHGSLHASLLAYHEHGTPETSFTATFGQQLTDANAFQMLTNIKGDVGITRTAFSFAFEQGASGMPMLK